MKIALISSQASSLINFRGPLLVKMRRHGHEIIAFAPDHDTETRNWLKANDMLPVDFQLARTGMNPFNDLKSTFELKRLLRLHSPDIALAYYIKPVIFGTLAAWAAGVKRRYAMVEGLGFAYTDGVKKTLRKAALQRMVSELYRVSLRLTRKVIFLNPDDRNEFLQRRLVSPRQAVVLGGIGLDLEEWCYAKPEQKVITFILVGRMLRDKGIEEFVAAARILRSSYTGLRFILVGGHDSNPSAIPLHRIQSWVEEGLIEWPGHVPVHHWLAQASVFVLPSYREGVPRSTQEAMAVGLPVVTTDVPGCRETVVDGINGYIVPSRDSIALARAMRHFIDDPDKILSMGRESRRFAEEKFDVHIQNQKIFDFIEL